MADLLTDTLFAAIDTFDRHSCPYALAGGLAVSVLVEPRSTVDIDICCLPADRDFARLFGLLATAIPNLQVNPQPMEFARVTVHRGVVLAGVRTVIVDLLEPSRRGYLESVIARRIRMAVGDRTVAVVCPEDLIILKTWAGRPQDAVDIENLRQRYAGKLDTDYLGQWLS